MFLWCAGLNPAGRVPEGCQEPPRLWSSGRQPIASPPETRESLDGQVAAVPANHAGRTSHGFFLAVELARGSQVNQAGLVPGGVPNIHALLQVVVHY